MGVTKAYCWDTKIYFYSIWPRWIWPQVYDLIRKKLFWSHDAVLIKDQTTNDITKVKKKISNSNDGLYDLDAIPLVNLSNLVNNGKPNDIQSNDQLKVDYVGTFTDNVIDDPQLLLIVPLEDLLKTDNLLPFIFLMSTCALIW